MKKEIEIIIPEGYKLSDRSSEEKLVLTPIDIEKEAKKFLINVFNKMQVRVKPDNIGYVYYDIDGITVFEQDFKTNTLWVSYTRIWNVFESVFSMNYTETQLFIKNMIEETLHWNGLIPVRLQFIP